VERDGRAAAWTGFRAWKKAAHGGLLLRSIGGFFFFAPYYQDTKSSTKIGQI
jgi:hypothetical protein